MFIASAPGVNFINILRAAFLLQKMLSAPFLFLRLRLHFKTKGNLKTNCWLVTFTLTRNQFHLS